MTHGVDRSKRDDAASESTTTRRRLPRRLWLIVALQALLMMGAAILYPAFQNADEVSHVDYVIAHRDGQWFDAPGTRHYQSGTLNAKALLPDTQFRTHVGVTKPLARSARKSIDALGTAPSPSPFPDQMTQHPLLYYGVAAGFTYLLPHFDQHRFDVQVFWLRLFSLLLLLPVPVLIFTTARRITGSQNVGFLAALLPLALPSYLRTGAAVSNDSMLLLLTTVVVAPLVRAAFGDLTRRTAVLVGVAWGGALLTKGFALSLPPAIILAYLVGASGSLGQRIKLAWRPVITAGVVGCVIGAWWWVRNLIDYHAIQPDGFGTLPENLRVLVTGRDRPGGTEVGFFENFVRLLGQRTFGSLGLIDVPSLPVALLELLGLILFLLLLGSIVFGFGPLRSRFALLRDCHWSAGRAVAMILPAVLTVAVMYAGARPVFLKGRQLPGIQVRYVLPAMLGLMICAAVVACCLAGRFARWLPPVLLTLTLGWIALSAYQVLDIEMSGKGTDRVERLKEGLIFVVGWSPFPTYGSVILLALGGLVAVVALVAFWGGAASDDDGREPVAVVTDPPRTPVVANPA